jgi:hypothetical protein
MKKTIELILIFILWMFFCVATWKIRDYFKETNLKVKGSRPIGQDIIYYFDGAQEKI